MNYKWTGRDAYPTKISASKFVPLLLVNCCICIVLAFTFAPEAQAQSPLERTLLTPEILQQRLHNPVLREGNSTVDLRQMTIDLRPDNAVFRDQFYQVLRKEIQKTGAKPLGLDLSNSLIQGDFIGSELGLRTTIYPQAISPTFTPTEQYQLQHLRQVCVKSLNVILPSSKDCRSLLRQEPNISTDISVFRSALIMQQTRFNGAVQFTNTFFLQPVDAQGAVFNQSVNFSEARFSRPANFTNTNFRKDIQLVSSMFFDKLDFKQTQFQDSAYFQDSSFEESVNFKGANFHSITKFNRARFSKNADFSQVRFFSPVQFTGANFNSFLLTEATFEQAITFREARFDQPVNLRGSSIESIADFSDTSFAPHAYLNVSGLAFNSNNAKILGNPGEIGKILHVSKLQGNQNVLRNLVQNFRSLQQIADINQLEYTKQQLRLVELSQYLFGININKASTQKLKSLAFTQPQIDAIVNHRQQEPFRDQSQLLALPEIDFDTYIRVRDQIIVDKPLLLSSWLLTAWSWLFIALLLLLSGYGTQVWLVFGVGTITITFFGLLYWFIDKFRRLRPSPIVPTCYETSCILTFYCIFTSIGLIAIFRNAEQPWLTLGCLLSIIIPIPLMLLARLYQIGRFHDKMDVSYFTEDGTLRQLRLLIGRLPVIPRNSSFRERYMPILWDRRWNWLNYYDFSLNNLMRLGFNDIRLRDEFLPGIISTLAWFQWSLGVLYITLLLWTLSRTIPGLNLLIYLK
ncbi:MAG: pentapeptide repeat-containing protein [Calothrix sp. C42_A2020_038]|nr:pentapeptide repeat-containing protein [Calothrix sp. C42_A2020_038]